MAVSRRICAPLTLPFWAILRSTLAWLAHAHRTFSLRDGHYVVTQHGRPSTIHLRIRPKTICYDSCVSQHKIPRSYLRKKATVTPCCALSSAVHLIH
jgi:hypothetical protein